MKQTSNSNTSSSQFAVVLIRGKAKMPQTIKDTLELLNLIRKHCCVLLENNPVNKGMLNKVKDYITWGEINNQTFEELIKKRGKEYLGRLTDFRNQYEYKVLKLNGKNYKNYFCLNPPRKGFERKGIKVSFNAGGALGYRGEKMNDLIMRML